LLYCVENFYTLNCSAGELVSNPAGVTVTRLTTSVFPGDAGYTQIDNPNGGGTITSGVWYNAVSNAGQVDNFASLTFTATEDYVVGIYTNNTDYANISPSDLRIQQVSGSGSGDSGLIANNPNREGDWFFFNVDGQAGDVFDISGIATAPGGHPNSDGIGAITFDAAPRNVPEPSSWPLFATGLTLLACAHLSKRRVW
jgi:hypothetical protein